MTPAMALFGALRVLGYLTEPSLGDGKIHQLVGEPARIIPPGEGWRALKVLTWNIQRGTQFDQVLKALKSLDADVYLLQEVDMFCRRSGKRNVAKDLADALGTNWLWAGEFQEIGESSEGVPALTGQAVLSRYPIEEASAIRFRSQARLRWRLNPLQPRRGGRVALRFRTGGVLIYNAHIESGGNDRLRRKQLDEILDDEAREAGDRGPVIIAGDFNNLPAIRSSMFGRLSAAAFADALKADGGPRQTSVRHRHPIDWIFVKNLRSTGGQLADMAGASDHYPVLARLTVER